jgi:hypothetical protein
LPALTSAGGTAAGTSKNRGSGQATAAVVPFIRASAQHREPAGIDVSRQITASDQDLGVFDIPAYGYVRSLIILVQATGGTGTSVTQAEDGPFAALKNVFLTEPNGAFIAAFNTGYECYLADKWGGLRDPAGSDMRQSPVYSAVAAGTGNFAFMIRVPVEINLRDGLGALPNQNAAATFKLRLTLASGAANAGAYGATIPTVQPTARVRVFLEAWDQPEQATAGASNQVSPPAMNTTQFWSVQSFNVNAGAQNIRLTRVGNYLRNLIFVYRRTASTRANGQTDWPDPATIYLDTRPLDIVEKNNWTHQMFERTGFGGALGASVPAYDSAGGLDNGVFIYDFTNEFDGLLGRENRDLWLPTLGSTRLELQGSFGTAGTLTVLTNDVAVAGNVFI